MRDAVPHCHEMMNMGRKVDYWYPTGSKPGKAPCSHTVGEIIPCQEFSKVGASWAIKMFFPVGQTQSGGLGTMLSLPLVLCASLIFIVNWFEHIPVVLNEFQCFY